MSPLLNLRPVLGDMPLSVTCGARPSLTVADAGRARACVLSKQSVSSGHLGTTPRPCAPQICATSFHTHRGASPADPLVLLSPFFWEEKVSLLPLSFLQLFIDASVDWWALL